LDKIKNPAALQKTEIKKRKRILGHWIHKMLNLYKLSLSKYKVKYLLFAYG